MLRRRFVSPSSVTPFLYQQIRCCSSTSSSSKSNDPITTRCIELDNKCSNWSLTQEDVAEALTLLIDLINGKKPLPEVKSHLDVIQFRDHEDPDSPTFLPRTVQAPYCISALYRVIYSYPEWETLMQIPPSNTPGTGGGEIERFSLKPKSAPSRELLAKGYVCSLPIDNSDMYKQYFMLGFPDKDSFKHLLASSNGQLVTSKVGGYELFRLIERTPLIKNKVAALREQQQDPEGKGAKKKEEYTFEGICVNIGNANAETAILANTPDTMLMAKRLSNEASLETSLVLTRAVLEDDMAYAIDADNFLFEQTRYATLVNDMISIVDGDASYYILQNAKGHALIFTSMHHLHRYRTETMAQTPQLWEEHGPWKIGAARSKSIDLIDLEDTEAEHSIVINPFVPSADGYDTPGPGQNVRFTRKTMEILKKLAKEKQKQQLKKLNKKM